MSYDQWKTTEPAEWPSPTHEDREAALADSKSRAQCAILTLLLADNLGQFKAYSPHDVAAHLEAARDSDGQDEEWDAVLAGLAETITWAARHEHERSEWLAAAHQCAMLGQWDDAIDHIERIRAWIRADDHYSDSPTWWDERANEPIGG